MPILPSLLLIAGQQQSSTAAAAADRFALDLPATPARQTFRIIRSTHQIMYGILATARPQQPMLIHLMSL